MVRSPGRDELVRDRRRVSGRHGAASSPRRGRGAGPARKGGRAPRRAPRDRARGRARSDAGVGSGRADDERDGAPSGRRSLRDASHGRRPEPVGGVLQGGRRPARRAGGARTRRGLLLDRRAGRVDARPLVDRLSSRRALVARGVQGVARRRADRVRPPPSSRRDASLVLRGRDHRTERHRLDARRRRVLPRSGRAPPRVPGHVLRLHSPRAVSRPGAHAP